MLISNDDVVGTDNVVERILFRWPLPCAMPLSFHSKSNELSMILLPMIIIYLLTQTKKHNLRKHFVQ